jgi:hypothetical protein
MPRTVDSVRQVTVDDYWRGLSPESETDQLTLSAPEESTVEIRVENYPYDEPLVFKGNFRYERGRVGTDTARGTYQIRSHSGLLVIRKESGSIHPDDVTDAISNAVNGDIEIHDTIILNREGLWSFVDSANKRMEIEVLTPMGEVRSLSELQEEEGLEYENVSYSYPIESARVFFKPPNTDVSIEVEYANDTLSVGAADDEAHEYVIQLFERDVIDGSE